MKKKEGLPLLGERVDTISINTLDRLVRIRVADKWFIETDDPQKIFGKGRVRSTSNVVYKAGL